ncbi:hypothetical protein BH18THE2_BH18THE2_38920 [soil metagenome]
MKVAVTVSSIALVIMILFLSSFSASNINLAQGQSLPSCPVGYQRNILGTCEPVSNLQTCPVGYQRSASGFCVPVVGSQSCPVGYQISASGCIPVTGSSFLNPSGYPTTTANPQTTLTQPQATFNQPSSPTASLVSPTLTNPPAGQMSPWFPSLPAIACGGTSTMTTIGSIESDSNSDNNNNNGRNNDDDDDDNDNKDYAFQIESDGGPSADPESVDGTVFAGEKNIERNNGRDFDIKDVFNDCQVGMFSK